MDAALKASGPKPESIDSLKNDVKKRLGESACHQGCAAPAVGQVVGSSHDLGGGGYIGDWYMRHHGVNPASTVADMCVLLKAYWQVATKRCGAARSLRSPGMSSG